MIRKGYAAVTRATAGLPAPLHPLRQKGERASRAGLHHPADPLSPTADRCPRSRGTGQPAERVGGEGLEEGGGYDSLSRSLEAKTAAWVRRSMPSLARMLET